MKPNKTTNEIIRRINALIRDKKEMLKQERDLARINNRRSNDILIMKCNAMIDVLEDLKFSIERW